MASIDHPGAHGMDAAFGQLQTLMELDARHDDILRQLEELDRRVTEAIAEYQPGADKGGNVSGGGAVQKPDRPLQGFRDAA